MAPIDVLIDCTVYRHWMESPPTSSDLLYLKLHNSTTLKLSHLAQSGWHEAVGSRYLNTCPGAKGWFNGQNCLNGELLHELRCDIGSQSVSLLFEVKSVQQILTPRYCHCNSSAVVDKRLRYLCHLLWSVTMNGQRGTLAPVLGIALI